MNADVMIKMGFFIVDLHRHIEQLHWEQFGRDSSKPHFTVYRGQGMNKEAFDKIVANKGGLLSFNNFLSTSKDRSISLNFAQRVLADMQTVGVLFVMNIDPARSSTPFACVANVGYFGNKEDELLFSMHTVFRIGPITFVNGNARLVQVQLDLASDKNNDLRQLTDYIRQETFPDNEGWYRLGQVLWKIGELAKAQQVYERLLRQDSKEIVKAPIYHQLGWVTYQQGEYAQAITYYEKSIVIEEKWIPRNDLGLAMSYNNMGLVFDSMGDYPKTLSFYEKDLEISQKSPPPTHPNLAVTYANMGWVHENMANYSQAHAYFERAVEIAQRSLPTNHPNLQKWRNSLAYLRTKL